MDRRCGQTFEDTLHLFHRYDDPEHPIPFLLIATWNDYEEGTQIETGVSDCHHKDENRNATSQRNDTSSGGVDAAPGAQPPS